MKNYDTRVITVTDILGEGYDTRVIVPRGPCPKCKAKKIEVVGAQCNRYGKIYGSFRCDYCGASFGCQMDL